jgi:glutaredoxin
VTPFDKPATPDHLRLTLLTRADCGLCEDAARELARLGARFESLDIDADPELQRRYHEAVPVLLLDGAEVGRAPLSANTLRSAAEAAGVRT